MKLGEIAKIAAFALIVCGFLALGFCTGERFTVTSADGRTLHCTTFFYQVRCR